jgi:hypothetical protein
MQNPEANIPWIDSPFFYSQLKESGLNDADKAFVKHFAEEGYVIFDPEVDLAVTDELVKEIAPHYEKNNALRIQDAWQFNEKVRYVATLKTVQEKLRLLYRREPLPFQTLNFPVGTQQNTHSDMIHFNSIPERFMCGVWIAFEDINDDNGPLHYYPQSHKLPFYDMVDIGVKASDNREWKRQAMAYVENYEIFIQQLIEALGLKKAVLNIKKGQAIIWSSNLLHGGEKILRPGASRHSQVTHYYFDNCVYYSPKLSDVAINKIYLTELRNINTGERLVSRYFDEVLTPSKKLQLQFKTVKMLSKVSHLFPRSFVDKMKSLLIR